MALTGWGRSQRRRWNADESGVDKKYWVLPIADKGMAPFGDTGWRPTQDARLIVEMAVFMGGGDALDRDTRGAYRRLMPEMAKMQHDLSADPSLWPSGVSELAGIVNCSLLSETYETRGRTMVGRLEFSVQLRTASAAVTVAT